MGAGTKLFKPFSRVERPVPPPIATTRSGLARADLSRERGSRRCGGSMNMSLVRLFRAVGFRNGVGPGIWIKQFRETRVLGQVLKIGVIARLEAEGRVRPDGLGQIPQR